MVPPCRHRRPGPGARLATLAVAARVAHHDGSGCRQRGGRVGPQLQGRRVVVPQGLRGPRGRGNRLGAALRVGQLPGDRVAERAPRGQSHGWVPPVRGARPRSAPHRCEPARRAGGQPPRRDGGPSDRSPQGRPVRRRLVELRRHPARGLSAPRRHARPGQRPRLPAPVVPDLPGQDLRAGGGREPPGHPGRRGAHGHGRRPHDRVPARDDLGSGLPPVPRQRDDREPPALEPVGPASLHREADRRARRRRGAAVHPAHRRPDPGGGRSGPDAAERQAPRPARRQHARGAPDARRGARRPPRSPPTSTCCATWAPR